MIEQQERLANMKKGVKTIYQECECCHQSFNWWDLLWDLEEDRLVCMTCYHKRELK